MIQTGLYVIACPIGDYDDITVRALRVLNQVDVIAAEDTRAARNLLTFHRIKAGNRLISCHEHNEQQRLTDLIARLHDGASVALISDAGTPTVSDPGFQLVRKAIEEGIPVVPVPGVSAVTAALSVSGLPTDAFFYEGFLPKKRGKRDKRLNDLAGITASLIFFESPQRIVETLGELMTSFGDRPAVLCREMTKPYQEFLRGRLSDIRADLEGRDTVKGEITLVVAGNPGPTTEIDSLDIAREMRENPRLSASALASLLSARYGLPKRRIYEEIVRTKRDGG